MAAFTCKSAYSRNRPGTSAMRTVTQERCRSKVRTGLQRRKPGDWRTTAISLMGILHACSLCDCECVRRACESCGYAGELLDWAHVLGPWRPLHGGSAAGRHLWRAHRGVLNLKYAQYTVEDANTKVVPPVMASPNQYQSQDRDCATGRTTADSQSNEK